MARSDAELHVCDHERRLDFVIIKLRRELEQFDDQVRAYLESPRGRFESWYAAHRR